MSVSLLGLLGLVLGLDSFRAAGILGLRVRGRLAGAALVLAFGFCDGGASFVGMVAGRSLLAIVEPHLRLAGTLIVAAYGLLLVRTVERDPARAEALALTVPLALSLDNIGAGAALAGDGFHALGAGAALGLASALLAAAGLGLGRFAAAHAPVRVTRLAGVLVVVLAVATSAGQV